MMNSVIKRDGSIQDFDENKIRNAVKKANTKAADKITEEKIDTVVKSAITFLKNLKKEELNVEEIHKAVENSLMRGNCFEVARQYMTFRQERDAKRFKRLPLVGVMESKLFAKNVVNQNANVDEASFGGRKGEMDSAFLKEHALNYYITPKYAKNHLNNEVYIHDLDSYILGMHNCESVPMDHMLNNNIYTRQVVIRPAGSVNTGFQLTAVYFQLQSLQEFGGVAATHLDWTLVPFVRKSFMKHFIVAYLKSTDEFTKLNLPDLMFQDYKAEDGSWRNKLDDWIDQHKHEYLERLGLQLSDFYMDNTNLDHNFRQAAIFDTISEIRQGVEGMLHNLNSLQSRSGNQLPFSSINYGTCTLPEGRIVIRAILDCTIKGTGNGQTSIFPCQIFQLKDGINTKKGDPNYDLFQQAIKCTARRMYPNYANCDWSVDITGFEKSQHIKQNVLEGLEKDLWWKLVKLPASIHETLGFKINSNGTFTMNGYPQPFEIMSTMGCRTYNGFDINFTEDYFLEEILKPTIENGELPKGVLLSGNQKDGRGNIAPATVILPTLAMKAKRKAEKAGNQEYVVDFFMDLLEKAIGDCKDELLERFDWICSQPAASADFMYRNKTFFHSDKEINEEGLRGVLKHGTLAIGQLGLAECLQILVGCDHTEEKGMELAKRIEQLFKDKCADYKERYRLNFGVYYTPAESLCGTAMQKFQKKYGKIPNISEKDYFTNSIHVPVWKEVSPFEKIDIESQLTSYSSAGCITYVEIGDKAIDNLVALEQIVLYAKSKNIPYFALNVKLSDCTECGYTGFIDWSENCPVCGADHSKINDYARVTGYLSTSVRHFNFAKQAETKDRFVNVNKLNTWNR